MPQTMSPMTQTSAPWCARWRPLALVCALLGSAGGAAAASPAALDLADAPDAELPAASVRSEFPALLSRVLARDPQLRSAEAAAAVSEARLRQLRSRLGPNLGVQVTRGRSRDLESTLPVDREVQRSEASLRWNLYNGGSDRAEWRAAELDLSASQAEIQRARDDVAARLAEAWFEVQRLDALRPVSRERLVEVRRLAQQVSRQAELGRAAEADVQQAQNALLDAQMSHDLLQAERSSAHGRLQVLAGEPIGAVVPMAWPADWVAPSAPAHAALRVAQARAEAARLRVRSLPESLAPRLDFDVRKKLSDRTTPQVSTVQQRGWTLGLNWDMPLGGETLARRDESQRRVEAADAEQQGVTQTAAAELQSLLPLANNLNASLTVLDQQATQLLALQRAGDLQYEAGRRSTQQLMQLRESRFALAQRRSELQARLLQTRLRQQALGGELIAALGRTSPADLPVMTADPLASAAVSPVVASVPTAPIAAAASTPSAVPAPAAAAPVATTTYPTDRMAAWLTAWNAKAVNDYLGFYAPDFTSGALSHARWLKQRQQRLSKPGAIEVSATDLNWSDVDAEQVEVRFAQHYRSSDYSDTVRKALQWRRVGGQWLIVQEKMLAP